MNRREAIGERQKAGERRKDEEAKNVRREAKVKDVNLERFFFTYCLLPIASCLFLGCSMYQVTEETNRETAEVIRLLEKFNHEQEKALRDMNLISNIKSATREQVQKQEKLHEMVKQQARYVRQDLYHNQNIHDNTAKMKKSFTSQITLNQGVLKSTSIMKENLEAAGELNKALTVKLDEAIRLNK